MVRFARVASSNLAPHFVLPNTGGNIVSIHERRRFLDRPRGLPIAGCTRAERPFYQFAAMLPTLRELQTHLARSRKHLAGSMSWSTMRASDLQNDTQYHI